MDRYLWKSFGFKGDCAGLLDLLKDEPHAFFLDSSQQEPVRGRFSFFGFDPFDIFAHRGRDTLDRLKKEFYAHAGGRREGYKAPFSPLTSGLVGCLGYDYGLMQEKIKLAARDDPGLPDAFFGFYDCVVTVDHFTQKLYITSSGLPERSAALRRARAMSRLAYAAKKIAPFLEGKTIKDGNGIRPPADTRLLFKANFSKERYMNAVQKALEYIRAGDIYQVNLSQRFEFGLDGRLLEPMDLYKVLRGISPAPFGGYLDAGAFKLISNSPERFLHLCGRRVETRPMKGTRPRGRDPAEDRRLRAQITDSPKEKAELLMITDLLRNDLGRVCDYGSVRVTDMRSIEDYEYVFQATSTVEGRLARDRDCFDLIRACFPGGSVTGCPKIRAMDIIEELEPTRRGMYTGSMGYISFDGCMDLNILIRTLIAVRNKLFFQVGGGIVADSVPHKEYEETLVKAGAMQAALRSCILGRGPAVDCSAKG